jgi:hypothetical protein
LCLSRLCSSPWSAAPFFSTPVPVDFHRCAVDYHLIKLYPCLLPEA